jgi:hypothetical protein
MPLSYLVRRSGVPRPVVYNLFRGNGSLASPAQLDSIRRVMGFGTDPAQFRIRHAEQRAARLARHVQGTMVLEAQGLAEDELGRLTARCFAQIMAESPRRLWA